MSDRPTLMWDDDDPDFLEKIFREVQTHGFANVYVSPEQVAASRQAIEARRKAAAKERRAKRATKPD